ncbi:MAG TPA: aryl-sulfate sulfotransferase [Candidatus Kapabacteria bacterium]|nr:aryl-sulfate sulfotransferase [Candidatus Kapabacteria bacterium]
MKICLTPLLVGMALSLATLSNAKTSASLTNSYPLNDSRNVNPRTSVGLTFSVVLDRTRFKTVPIQVTGTIGGTYNGTQKLSADAKTLIFTPSKPFALGEAVSILCGALPTADGGRTDPQHLSFTTRDHTVATIDPSFHSDDPIFEEEIHNDHAGNQLGGSNHKVASEGTQSFPFMTVVNNDNPSEGKVYIANFKFAIAQSSMYRMILDKGGNVLFAQTSGPSLTLDFKPEKNGTYTYYDASAQATYVLDSNFTVIDTIMAANGYQTDGHELMYGPDGSYYIIAIDNVAMDMRPYVTGGDSAATVLDNVVQGFDKEKNLIFEWRGLDHYKITHIENEQLTGQGVDYCHMNAIEIDSDANILVSCRHLDEITKIDQATGNIIWRMGGKNNQFTFTNDTIGFSHQHAIRRTDAGTYTMYDNGNYHKNGGTFSRALEYKLDQTNKTATEVWEFRHSPQVFGSAMGYVQRLPNGNTLIGWGACNSVAITEVGPFGRTEFELAMDSMNYSYRAYKFPENYFYSSVKQISPSPAAASLLCVPDPVNTHAEIRFSTFCSGEVSVVLYDELGKQVRQLFDGDLSAGSYTAALDADGLTNGVYHVRITSTNAEPLDEQILVLR